MNSDLFSKSIKSNCLGEFEHEGNVCVLYIEFNDAMNRLIIGTCSNIGIIPILKLRYDDDYSIDSSIEAAIEELMNKGYSPL